MQRKEGEAAPTGCYKCGRPGHWSRDCPFTPSDSNTNTNPNPNPNPNPNSTLHNSSSSSSFSRSKTWTGPRPTADKSSSENPKKRLPRTRPKLTPDLLLSDDGLGYVLRHFPRAFKYRGRGHEVSDLQNLIGLYAQWHSRLLPYYSFDQFVHKVEQVGATRRVRMCMRELRDRVANGGDPTKLHEPPVELVTSEPGVEEATNAEGADLGTADPPGGSNEVEELFDEIYKKATEEPCQPLQNAVASAEPHLQHNSAETQNQIVDSSGVDTNKAQISDEQKARMEANRLKALQRIAARSCSSVAT